MKKIFYLLSLTTIFCCAFFQNLHSETTPRSTRGKEFWVGWPDNSNDQNPSYCGVFIFAKRLTKVSAIYEGNEMKYILSDTNKFFVTFGLWDSQEVQDSEVKLKKGVRIVADDSVDVYISSMATVHGLESTVAYPITALAKDYYVLTRKEGSAQTQFQIVAAYDSTEIEITPSATTELGKPAFVPFVITLNKFETYLVRSSGDLTGTKVRSVKKEICQPFALFAGSPRTTIGGCSPNGFLWEQIPPASLVGTNYIVPHYPFSSGSILRAMAIYPGTLLRLDGMGVGNVLSSGQFFDMNVETFANVTANKPIMLAQFTRGGGCTPTSPSVPTMTILSAISQFQYETYITPALGNLIFPTDTLTLSIITRFSERGVTRINNQPVNINDWKIIPSNPIYAAYQKPVFLRDTIKIFHDMSGFNATIFGGNANQSFAMSSGGSFANTVSVRFDTSGIYGKNAYCKGEVANFSVSADSSGSSFRWEFGDGSSDTGKTVSHIYENSGNYILRLIVYRETFCAYDTTRKIINVRPSPAIKAGARPTLTLCKGQTAQLGLPELPGISYRWSPAIGLSDTTVGQPTVTATLDSVKYFVRGYDSFGCETRDSIVVKLYDQPIANAGPDTVSCGGNGVQIGRQTTGGTPNYSFLWTPAKGLSNDKIERPIAAPSTNTTYILRVTDANGCITYDTVNIQALPSPTINIATAPTICEGDSVQLVASGAPTYRWVNARNISDTTIGNPTVYPSVTTTYYVAGLFETGCVAFDSVLVTVTPKPRLPIAFQTTACPNATKTYTVENRGDLTYNWEVTGGNLTNGQGSNEATVIWGVGPTGSIKLTTTTTAGSCSFDTTVNITISSSIKPTITESKKNTIVPSLGTVRICPNESVTLDVGVGYTEITWTNGSTSRQTTVNSEGWYGVSVKDATGCSGGDSVFVQIVPPPTVFAGNDRVLCGADTAVMRPTVTGSGSYTYQWIPPTAVSDPTSLVTNFIAPNTTNLIFQAIDTANGCITSDTVLMTILTLAGDFITTSKGNNVLCFGEQMILDAGAFDSYLWSTGETTRTITINNGGSYWVDAKSGSCSAIDTIQIIQNPQIVVIPTPDIIASPGATVTLDANATGGTLPYQFQWTPNVNFVDPPTVQSPRVTANVGSQTYIITITDGNGCIARDTITVFVPSTATTVAIARREVSATAFGERFPITASLTPNTPITPSGFTATITVPFEQFIPKSVSNGTMTMTQTATDYVINITVPITEPIQNGDVITELIGDILLGQQDSTTIVLTSAQWTGTTYPVTTQNGRIVLNDVCYSGTRRYLLPTTVGFGILSVHPNPSNTKATFEFGIIEAGQTTFEIIDVFGNVVHSTSWTRQPATPKGGTDDSRTTHTVDVSNLPSGTYYGVLKSFSQRATVPVVITK